MTTRADGARGPDDAITELIRHGRDREAAELASERLAPEPSGAPGGPISHLDCIVPLLNRLVAQLTTDQLDASTPCAEFTVRQILDHMVTGATTFAAAFRGEDAPAVPAPDDVVAAFPEALAELQSAMRSAGAMERTVAAPFGEVEAETFARFVAFDGLVHGWDIATATGQPFDPPPDVVREVDAFAREALSDHMRDGRMFAAAVAAPGSASALERLAAFTGRTVG